MTVNEVLNLVDDAHDNSIERSRKLDWLNDCEAFVQEDIMLIEPEREYGADDGNKALIAPRPFDKLYAAYIDAQIFYYYQEYRQYANASAVYDKLLADFAGWYAEKYDPLHGGRMEFPEDEE